MEETELYHHGIKGMKWGVRRTPAQLGHDTSKKKRESGESIGDKAKSAAKKVAQKTGEAAGKYKAKRAEEKARKAEEEARAKEIAERKKPRNVKDMSDQELAAYAQRLNMERNVLETQKRISELQPQKVSAGKKYMDKFVNDAVMPAVSQVSKDYLTKLGKEVLGLDQKTVDAMGELKKEVENLRLVNEKGSLEEQISNRAKRQKKSKAKTEEQKQSESNPRQDDRDTINVTDFTVEDVPRQTYNSGRDYLNGYLDTPITGYFSEPRKKRR